MVTKLRIPVDEYYNDGGQVEIPARRLHSVDECRDVVHPQKDDGSLPQLNGEASSLVSHSNNEASTDSQATSPEAKTVAPTGNGASSSLSTEVIDTVAILCTEGPSATQPRRTILPSKRRNVTFDQLEYATAIGKKVEAITELAVGNSPKRRPRGEKVLPSKRKNAFDLLEYTTGGEKEVSVDSTSLMRPREELFPSKRKKTFDLFEYATTGKRRRESTPKRRVDDGENVTISALQKSTSPKKSPKRRRRPKTNVVQPHPPQSVYADILSSFISTPFDDKSMLNLHKLKQGIPLPQNQYQGFQMLQSSQTDTVPIIPQKSIIKSTRAKQNGRNRGINPESSAAISAEVSSFLIEEGRKLINSSSSLPLITASSISQLQAITTLQHGGGDIGSEKGKDDEGKRRSMVAKNVARGIQITTQRAEETSRIPKKAKLDAVALRALAALESSDSSGDEGGAPGALSASPSRKKCVPTKRKKPSSLVGEGASAKRRKKCNHDECDNFAVQGGVCIRHGAKVKKCSHEGCTKNAQNRGLCWSHRGKYVIKTCSAEGCTIQVIRGGVCWYHGAKD